MSETLISKFERRLTEHLDNPEGATPAVLKIALEYIKTKMSADVGKAGAGFKEDDDE